MSFVQLLKLCRPLQWYKNFLVFLPLIFTSQLFKADLFMLSFAGFVALCFMSSANYILNDIFDVKKDRLNPEKRSRPLASENVSLWQALLLCAVLFVLSLVIGIEFSSYFFFSLLFLNATTLWYSILLKNEVILDVLIIAINFVIRAVSGTFLINSTISPWLVLCTFFLSLFLSVAKRESELVFLGGKAIKHRISLGKYNENLTNILMSVSTALLIVSYSLYSFLSHYKNLLFTLPFALYVIFRYSFFVYSGSEIARHPEKILKDWRMMLGILLWIVAVIFITQG